MDWPHFVGTLVSSLVTAAILAWLLRSGNRSPKLAGDAVEIGPSPGGRALLIFAGLVLLAMAGLFVALVLTGNADPKLTKISWLAVPMFVGLGVPTLLEARVRLWMDSEGLRGRTAFRGWREVLWQDIENVRYSKTTSCIVLRDHRGETIRVSRMHRGHNCVFDVLAAKVPQAKWEQALRDYVDKHATRIRT
ncbi:MAG TPA: hypothetical protein VFD82_24990 [Planctomycetota bacterium]|nr:hypothetical protein [Planctomycetota bacterium]